MIPALLVLALGAAALWYIVRVGRGTAEILRQTDATLARTDGTLRETQAVLRRNHAAIVDMCRTDAHRAEADRILKRINAIDARLNRRETS